MSSKNKLTKEEELRMNNQLLRAKIELITGRSMPDCTGGPDIPPRIENHFLTNILKMEEARARSRQITIAEYLNHPKFRPEQELSDGELTAELEKVEELLSANQIMCDTICEVDERVFYKFITEELMKEMILNVRVPGMTTVFTYEDFHPNHEYDATRVLADFLQSFANNELDNRFYFVDPSFMPTLDRIKLFRNAFCEIRNILHEVTGFRHNEKTAEIRFSISFDGIVSHGQEPIHYRGAGKMKLNDDYGIWRVREVVMPPSESINSASPNPRGDR